MALKPVTYYLVECDVDGCPVDTGSLGDFSAWGEPEMARADWEDSRDGIVLPDGRAYCDEHAKAHRCQECGNVEGEDGTTIRVLDDGYGICPACEDVVDLIGKLLEAGGEVNA